MLSTDNQTQFDMANKIDFPTWLQNQLNERGWSQSDLANRAKIHRQVVWAYLNRRKKPGTDILKKIAKALDVPVEQIYQVTGMLAPEPESDILTKTIMHLINDLDNDEKSEVIEYVKLRRRLSRKSKDNN